MAIDVVSTSLNSAPTATLAMSTLKVSIPPHLREILDPLVGLLPPELEELLMKSLDGTDIMYTTLVDISKWAFTEEGKQKLETKNLNFRDYDRISLLAGTVTGPASRLPPPEPKPAPWEVAQDEKNTRRAIAALVNGLFSVVGIGAAVWWASKTSGWSDVTRMGLAMAGGLVTALAEGGLFVIYYNRRENARKYRQKRREKQKERLDARYRKLQNGGEIENADAKETDELGADNEVLVEEMGKEGVEGPTPLRRRKQGQGPDEEDS